MAPSSILDFRVLIVPGLHGSGPDHWQTRWQQRNPWFETVEQLCWDLPDIDAWADELDRALRRSSQPALLAAHSFGCLTAVACAAQGPSAVAAALLVAPADPRKFGLDRQLRQVELPYPSLLVGSRNDPWMGWQSAQDWARVWGSDFVDAGESGHINADSRLGDWTAGLGLLISLASAIPTRSYRQPPCGSCKSTEMLKISI